VPTGDTSPGRAEQSDVEEPQYTPALRGWGQASISEMCAQMKSINRSLISDGAEKRQ